MNILLTASSRRLRVRLLLFAQLWCVGCAGIGPAGEPLAAPALRQTLVRIDTAGPFLYVGGSKLSMYSLGGTMPLHSTATSAVARAALALDSHGDLCEANDNVSAAAIYAFDARTLTLKSTLSGEGFGALAADRFGYLYGSNGVDIFVYAPGCTHRVNIVRHCSCWPLAFDHAGNLYAGAGREVRIYTPAQKRGALTFVRALRDGIDGTAALAVGRSGALFVANSGDSSVSVFAPNSSTPKRRITKGLDYPEALAVDSRGSLYVANVPDSPPSAAGWVSVYAPGRAQPVRYLRYRRGVAPSALVVDPSDNLYVATYVHGHSAVQVYDPGARKLLRTIVKDVDRPTALLIGSP